MTRSGINLGHFWLLDCLQLFHTPLLSIPLDNSDYYSNLLFSPDGKTLASYGAGSSSFALWDVVGQEPLAHGINEDDVSSLGSVAFSPNGRQLATLTANISAPGTGALRL
jgi:WD40 repeat protein